MIVLPGGIGTLSEMALAWSLMQVGEIDPRPLSLLGQTWHETMNTFNNPPIIRPEHLALLHFANSPESAVSFVVAAISRAVSCQLGETMNPTIFLKLGGSLITEKTGVEEVRGPTLARLAQEIRRACEANPGLKLVLGHGSGSFGHVHAAQHGTRQGVRTADQWHGFAQVSAAASRLNELVMAALLKAGVPALSLQPSASALCEDGQIKELAVRPVNMTLQAGLLPVVFGDVAFDTVRGGTIISTEEVMMFLAETLRPSWLLLAGETPGVLDLAGQVVPLISAANLEQITPALGGSRGTDVTGGMAGKVRSMLDLVSAQPQMQIRIFSGLEPGTVQQTLLTPERASGTVLRNIAE